jgi:hypothetical protein
MKTCKLVLSLFLLIIGAVSHSFAQESDLLDALPTTKEEFIQSEKKVLATINWLENTPLDQDEKKHQEQYAFLTAWITNSPTVTIELNANVLTFKEMEKLVQIEEKGELEKWVNEQLAKKSQK